MLKKKNNLIEKVLFGLAITVCLFISGSMAYDVVSHYSTNFEEVQIELVFEDYINQQQSHVMLKELLPEAEIITEDMGSSLISVKTKDKKSLIERLRRSIGIKEADIE